MRTQYREIARLKRKEVSNRKIAEILNTSRNTVNRIVQIMVERGLGCDEIEGYSDQELVTEYCTVAAPVNVHNERHPGIGNSASSVLEESHLS